MTDFSGKTVVITGGASGIGAALAELAAEQGARVAVIDLDERNGTALVARLGGVHRFVKMDVSDAAAWPAAYAEVSSALGGIDVVALNAGVMTRPAGTPIFNDPLEWMTGAALGKVLGVNVAGVVHGILAVLPHLEGRAGATILVTASNAGVKPFPGDPFYAMSKHALVGLASSLAPALAERGIRIVTVCPAGIDTPMCPPDLHERKQAENSFSSPRFMAEAFAEIFDCAKTGEIWMGGHQHAPWIYRPASSEPADRHAAA